MSDFRKELSEKSGVGGWLLLLCIALTIISPLRSIYSFVTSYYDSAILFDQYPGIKNIFYIDGFLSAILMILSIRAGSALWTIKPGAVSIAKNFLLIFLGYSVIAIFLPFTAGLPSEANSAMIIEGVKNIFQSLIFFGIWYSYLNVSKRVKATYCADTNGELK